MTKYIVPIISFIAGSCFGVLTMCCLFANRLDEDDWDEDDEDDQDEGVTEFAGGHREQDSEPCDYDDEADGEGGDRGGPYVSWKQEAYRNCGVY